MQAQSTSTPHSQPLIAVQYDWPPSMRTSPAAASPWLEAPDRTRYRDPQLQKALSEDLPRILIVADLATSVQMVALLGSIGRFETRMACSADAALGLAHGFLPNIALMSTDLPDLASYRLAALLRWDSKLLALRLIALSRDIPGTHRGRTLAVGFEQYLSLPVQSAALERALAPRVDQPGRSDLRGTRRRPN